MGPTNRKVTNPQQLSLFCVSLPIHTNCTEKEPKFSGKYVTSHGILTAILFCMQQLNVMRSIFYLRNELVYCKLRMSGTR